MAASVMTFTPVLTNHIYALQVLSIGNKRMAIGTFAMSGTYATYVSATDCTYVRPSDLGLKTIYALFCVNSTNLTVTSAHFDAAVNSIVLFSGATEYSAGALSGNVNLIAIGE